MRQLRCGTACLMNLEPLLTVGERGGSVVACRTPEREVRDSRPTSAVLCPWARYFTPRKYWLITQEAMALWLSGGSLKQRLTIHTIYPYATKQRLKYARSVVKRPCHVYALKESSHFIDFSILHCPGRATISVSAYYIRDCQRICFVVRISELAPRVY